LREGGRFIADFLNENFPREEAYFEYIDFYMGTVFIKNRGDLTPIYEYVFKRLKDMQCDWRYSFPKVFLIEPPDVIDNSSEDELKNYKPEVEFAKQLEKKARAKTNKKEFEELNKQSYEDAKNEPLDKKVQAYKNVYGNLPDGHPQKEFE